MAEESAAKREDPHRIANAEDLRALIGEIKAGVQIKLETELDAYAIDYIERSPFIIVSTASADGSQDASPKGDAPGFVLVEDSKTLVIPDRLGNRLVFGHLNLLENPRIGILFMIPGTDETLRVNGRAELTADPELLEQLAARGRPAVLAIRVSIDEAFFHCAKAFIRSKLWKPDTWGERYRVSFAEIFGKKLGLEKAAVEQIEAGLEEDYRTEL